MTSPHPGVFLWRAPHGHWFLSTNHGTQHLGPLPDTGHPAQTTTGHPTIEARRQAPAADQQWRRGFAAASPGGQSCQHRQGALQSLRVLGPADGRMMTVSFCHPAVQRATRLISVSRTSGAAS